MDSLLTFVARGEIEMTPLVYLFTFGCLIYAIIAMIVSRMEPKVGNHPNSDFEPTADYFEHPEQSDHDVLANEEIEAKLQQAQSILEQGSDNNSQQEPSSKDHLVNELASMTNTSTASDLQASTDNAGSQSSTAKQIALADFKQGMLVSHQRYGSGVIVSISGSGDKLTATIKFLDQQQRQFRLALAVFMYMDS